MFSFINGRQLVLDLLNTLYKFHSHSIYVQSVPKNSIYQVYEYVRNYHRSLRRNANETFKIEWLLKDNVKYNLVKLTVFILIKVLFDYLLTQEFFVWKIRMQGTTQSGTESSALHERQP